MKTKNKVIVGILVLISIVILLNNNSEKKVDDDCIKTDIQTEDSAFIKHGLVIDSLNIIERKTTEDGSLDMICLIVTASNDELTYTAQYDIVYAKYQDGWHLEGFQNSTYDYVSKIECPISIVEEAIREKTKECGEATAIKITDREGDMSYQTIYCSFTLVGHSGITRELTARISCSFSEGSWHESSTTLYRADTGEMIVLLEYYLW